MDLLTLYRGATADNECPLMVSKDLPSCGKSRFGCWVCTMVEKDKSMEAMIANDEEKAWMTPLLEFRNQFGDANGDRERRSFRRMNGSISGNHGKLFHGPYKKEIREAWLRQLLEMQKNINEIGPEQYRNLQLIHIEELRAIRRIWVFDKHEFDDSLPRIYENATGIPFSDPEWIRNESFGSSEWETLKQVCNDAFRDEELAFEMMYSLIDIENRATGINNRKSILDDLESVIHKTFYKNEEDALAFYRDNLTRSKELGGQYREKFFDGLAEEVDNELDEENAL